MYGAFCAGNILSKETVLKYQIISPENVDGTFEDIWSEYDSRLRSALSTVQKGVALDLPAELTIDSDALDRLEQWNEKFVSINRQFFIIAHNDNQIQCLELSHPDQNLHFFSSLDQLQEHDPSFDITDTGMEETGETEHDDIGGKEELDGSPEARPVVDPVSISEKSEPTTDEPVEHHAPPQTEMKQQAAAMQETEERDREEEIREPVVEHHSQGEQEVEDEEESEPVIVHVGDISETSGEFICLGCSMARMYLKGDTIEKCENSECLHPDAGWKLAFDLF
jgi:hypothetical protein